MGAGFNPPRPAINSFRPADGIWSYTVTAKPAADSVSAAIKPAGPAPITATWVESTSGREDI